MRKHYLFITVAALFLFTACGDETTAKSDVDNATPDEAVVDDTTADDQSDQSDPTDQTDQSVTDDTVTDTTTTDEGATDDILTDGEATDEDIAVDPLVTHLAGVWAQKLELFADANVPVVNEIVTRTDKIIRMVFKEEGGKAVIDSIQTCYLETKVTEGNAIAMGITTYFPEKFRNNFFYIGPGDLAEPKDDLEYSGTVDNFSFKMNRWYEMRGAYYQGEEGTVPFDIETEMVTGKDDPRIFDQDEDGKPGETFEINSSIASGLIWGVIKNYMEITSTSGANDRIEGTVLWNEVEVVIDADNALFKGDRTVSARAVGNTMIMKKLPVQTMDCAGIVENQGDLFQ